MNPEPHHISTSSLASNASDPFSDLFTLTDPPPSHGNGGSATATSWVESLYQTIIDPSIESKAVTLLTESPINANASSPTISQASSPSPQRKTPRNLTQLMETRQRQSAMDAQLQRNPLLPPNVPPPVRRSSLPSFNTSPPPLPDSLSIPSLQHLKDGLAEYTRVLGSAARGDIIRPRTDFLIGYLKRDGGNIMRPKAINAILADIRKDRETGLLTSRVGDAELITEISNLITLSDKRRKSYNKKRSQRQQSTSTETSTPEVMSVTPKTEPGLESGIESGMESGMESVLESGMESGMEIDARVDSRLELREPRQDPRLQSRMDFLDSGMAIDQSNVASTGIGPPGSAKSFKIGFCHPTESADPDTFVYIADFNDIPQLTEDQSYIQQLRTLSPGLRVSVDGIYTSNTVFSHPLTYLAIPLQLNRRLPVDIENDRIVSYAETVVEMNQTAADLELQSSSVHRSSSSSGVPPDFQAFVPLKAVTRIYSGNMLLTRKTDPVTGYFVAPSSRSVRVMLPLQAGVWASLVNDLHNGIITDSHFQQLCITQTLLKADGKLLHSFLWDFQLAKDARVMPVSIIVRCGPPPSAIPSYVRGHKRARSRSLNELDLITLPFSSERVPSSTCSDSFSFNTSNGSTRRPSDWSLQYSETPLPTPVEPSFILENPPAQSRSMRNVSRISSTSSTSQPIMFRLRPKMTPDNCDTSVDGARQFSDVSSSSSTMDQSPLQQPKQFRFKVGLRGASASDSYLPLAPSSAPGSAVLQSKVLYAQPQFSTIPVVPTVSTNPQKPKTPRTAKTAKTSKPTKSTKTAKTSKSSKSETGTTAAVSSLSPNMSASKGLSNAVVARSAQEAGCSVDRFKVRVDSNYKFKFYNPEEKEELSESSAHD